MPALFPIILTATQIVLVADPVPKFDVEGTCRADAVSGLPGRDSAACQRDEQGARSMLQKDWTEYSSTERIGNALLDETNNLGVHDCAAFDASSFLYNARVAFRPVRAIPRE